jgi:hypothetical protein
MVTSKKMPGLQMQSTDAMNACQGEHYSAMQDFYYMKINKLTL